MTLSTFILAVDIALTITVLVRVMLRPHRAPASRIAWVAVIVSLPLVGVIAYMLFGEVNIGRRRLTRMREIEQGMPAIWSGAAVEHSSLQAQIPERYEPLFRVGHSISGFEPIAGNSARLMADSNASISARNAIA